MKTLDSETNINFIMKGKQRETLITSVLFQNCDLLNNHHINVSSIFILFGMGRREVGDKTEKKPNQPNNQPNNSLQSFIYVNIM